MHVCVFVCNFVYFFWPETRIFSGLSERRTLGFSSCAACAFTSWSFGVGGPVNNCNSDWCCLASFLNRSGLQFAQLPHEPLPICKSDTGEGQAHPANRGKMAAGSAVTVPLGTLPTRPARLRASWLRPPRWPHSPCAWCALTSVFSPFCFPSGGSQNRAWKHAN